MINKLFPVVRLNLKRGLIFCLLLPLTLSFATAAEDYLQIEAQPGDGIYSILRRYKLDGFRCNFDKFYTLNSLAKNAGLRVGKNYFLPIKTYDFDGKSIRTTMGISDWDLAVKIRDYNRNLADLGLIDGSYEVSMLLLVPHHVINCEDQSVSIPAPVSTDPEENTSASSNGTSSSNGQRLFPVFGSTYAYTPLASTKLRGQVFYIVSGHGGPDPGAMGLRLNNKLCEDEYAYDVALRVCRNLIAHGATAYMINRDPNDGIRDDEYLDCDTDEVIWGGIRQARNQKVRLTQRSDVINELYEKHRLQGVTKQKMVVIHVDSRNQGEKTDVFFYHYPGSEDGERLAKDVHRTMRQKYRRYRANGEYHGTVTARDLHMLRECKPTSVYVELGNIRNSHDQQRIIIKRNRELLADWMLEALMD